MNEKLRECPFCGKEISEIKKQPFDYGYKIDYTIECDYCSAEMSHHNKELLISNWNTRSINTPKHETVEELRVVTINELVNEFNKRLESICCPDITCEECNLRECPVSTVRNVLKDHHGKPDIEG